MWCPKVPASSPLERQYYGAQEASLDSPGRLHPAQNAAQGHEPQGGEGANEREREHLMRIKLDVAKELAKSAHS